MRAKLKPFLIILFTLIIGIAIGFEVSEIMIKIRFDEMRAFKEPKGFVKIFEEIIEPDNNQKPKTDSILLKYHVKMENVTKRGMSEVSEMFDSMKVELKSVLNPEQIKRLDEEMLRMKRQPPPPRDGSMHPPKDGRMMPPPKGNRPPPPPPDGDRQPPPNDFMP
jgi:hypothetical protein